MIYFLIFFLLSFDFYEKQESFNPFSGTTLKKHLTRFKKLPSSRFVPVAKKEGGFLKFKTVEKKQAFDEESHSVIKSISEKGACGNDGMVVFKVYPQNNTLIVKKTNLEKIDENRQILLEKAPSFVRNRLYLNLLKMSDETVSKIKDVYASIEDKRIYDEFFYTVAYMPYEELMDPGFEIEILKENAEFIYKIAPYLDYVELVDVGDSETDENYYTTVKYKIGNGETYELPYEYYYAYIVNMRLDAEKIDYVSTFTGKETDKENGVFWRDYLFFKHEDQKDYTDHFIFFNPLTISDDELNQDGVRCFGYYDNYEVGPLKLIKNQDNRICMMEFRIGGGTIIATQLNVEEAYSKNLTKLLKNVVMYGYGNALMYGGNRHLLIQDEKPDEANSVETLLQELGVLYDKITSDEIETVDLENYYKVIIPSNQPLKLYEKIGEFKEKFEERLKKGNFVFEFHGATDKNDEWCGVMMPGNFTCGSMEDGNDDELFLGGQPFLQDIIKNTSLVWDGKTYKELSGDRKFDPETFALDKIGFFVSQNMFDNIKEHAAKYPITTERSIQPVRIINNHYGNCGELQDMLTSTSRTLLIPIVNVSDSNEDHVWNEVYLNDKWLPFQVSWSDGPTHINNPAISYEKKFGGGKDISVVAGYLGTGELVNKTPHYTDTFPLTFKIMDKDGNPVDGALIVLASEAYYEEQGLIVGYWAYTDPDGEFSIDLGDNQNFYAKIITPIGNYPQEDNMVAPVIMADMAIPDKERVFEYKFENKKIEITQPQKLNKESFVENLSNDDRKVFRIEISSILYRIEQDLATGYHYNKIEEKNSGVDVYFLDEENFKKFENDEKFDPMGLVENTTKVDINTAVCGFNPFYVVIRPARFYLSHKNFLNIKTTLYRRDEKKEEKDAFEVAGSDTAESDKHATSDTEEQTYTSEKNEEKDSGGGCSISDSYFSIFYTIFYTILIALFFGLIKRKIRL